MGRHAALERRTPLRAKKGLRRRTPFRAAQKTARKLKAPYRSIFTDSMGTCYVTGSTENVEPHHIFGASDKALSEKYGFMLPLRRDWHRGTGYSIHGDAAFSLAMKIRCQEYYVGVLGKSVREWQGEFRKWYTEDDMGKQPPPAHAGQGRREEKEEWKQG